MTQTTQTMTSLKDVGTKLGKTTTKTGFMRNVAEYVNQHRGELIGKKQILSDLNLQDKDKQHIENCYHNGYILKGQHLGDDCYFVPNLSDQDLISVINQFENLGIFSQEKLQLIQQLLQELISSSNATSNIPKDNASPQNPPSQEEASKQSGTAKTFLQERIELLEEKIKTLEQAVLGMQLDLNILKASYNNEPQAINLLCQEIKEKEREMEAAKDNLHTYKKMLPQIS